MSYLRRSPGTILIFLTLALTGSCQKEEPTFDGPAAFVHQRSDGTFALLPAGTPPSDGKVATVGKQVGGTADMVAERPDGGLAILGWAADVAAGTPAEAIVVFARGKSIATGRTGVVRADVATHFQKEQLRNAGFSIVIPAAVAKNLSVDDVRVFGILGDKAGELYYAFRE